MFGGSFFSRDLSKKLVQGKAFSLSVTVCCLPAETLLVLQWKCLTCHLAFLAYCLFFQIPELTPSSQLYLSLVQMLVESLRIVVLTCNDLDSWI